MTLRVEFEGLNEGKISHRNDHMALHMRHNAVASVDKPGTAAENAANLAAAIKAATLDRGSVFQLGGTVFIGPGDYVLTDTVELRQIMGLRFVGCGYATRFVWDGPADKPMFKLAHCRDVDFGHMFLSFPKASLAGVQIVRDNAVGSTIVPVHNHLHHIWMDGGNCLVFGFLVDGVDANNDFHLFEHCEVANYADSAWRLPTSQSYNNKMVNCRAIGNGATSKCAVKTGGHLAGTFYWSGGATFGNTECDFYMGRSYQPYIIEFCNSENSTRFIYSDRYNTIRVVGCRYAANKLHVDGHAIWLTGGNLPYHLTVQDCIIGDSAPVPLTLRFEGSDANYAQSGVVIRNTKIYSSAASVWSARTPHIVETSMQITDEQTLASKQLV